MVIENEYV
jgi:hypothetical protein